MKRTTFALAVLLALGLAVPASARPLTATHHQRSAWAMGAEGPGHGQRQSARHGKHPHAEILIRSGTLIS